MKSQVGKKSHQSRQMQVVEHLRKFLVFLRPTKSFWLLGTGGFGGWLCTTIRPSQIRAVPLCLAAAA